MKITQQTQAWGNSTGIRLPKKVLEAVGWQPDQDVTIDVKDRSIVLTPLPKSKKKSKLPALEELLAVITPENIHGEADWGPPVGKEIW